MEAARREPDAVNVYRACFESFSGLGYEGIASVRSLGTKGREELTFGGDQPARGEEGVDRLGDKVGAREANEGGGDGGRGGEGLDGSWEVEGREIRSVVDCRRGECLREAYGCEGATRNFSFFAAGGNKGMWTHVHGQARWLLLPGSFAPRGGLVGPAVEGREFRAAPGRESKVGPGGLQ